MNRVIILGRLGKPPELRYTQTSKAVASFDIAVDDGYGEHKQTIWVPIVVWGKQAESCTNYLDKGSKVLVEGRISIRSYEANDGTKRRVTEVIAESVQFLDKPKQSGNEPAQGNLLPDDDLPADW